MNGIWTTPSAMIVTVFCLMTDPPPLSMVTVSSTGRWRPATQVLNRSEQHWNINLNNLMLFGFHRIIQAHREGDARTRPGGIAELEMLIENSALTTAPAKMVAFRRASRRTLEGCFIIS